jgi:hypothetical protein
VQFPNAIKLLRQRREEIVRQLEWCLDNRAHKWQGNKRVGVKNKEFKKIQQVYKQVQQEIETLEQL